MFTATRAKRQLRYVDQQTAIDYIEAQDDLDIDRFMALNDKKYLNLAETAFKEAGELLPGITVDETEYLTVRENKKGTK